MSFNIGHSQKHEQINAISSQKITIPTTTAAILKEKNIKCNWSQPTYIHANIHAHIHMLWFKQEGILCAYPLTCHEGISLWIVYVHYQYLQAVFWSWMTWVLRSTKVFFKVSTHFYDESQFIVTSLSPLRGQSFLF